jgi:hypothetical protein
VLYLILFFFVTIERDRSIALLYSTGCVKTKENRAHLQLIAGAVEAQLAMLFKTTT